MGKECTRRQFLKIAAAVAAETAFGQGGQAGAGQPQPGPEGGVERQGEVNFFRTSMVRLNTEAVDAIRRDIERGEIASEAWDTRIQSLGLPEEWNADNINGIKETIEGALNLQGARVGVSFETAALPSGQIFGAMVYRSEGEGTYNGIDVHDGSFIMPVRDQENRIVDIVVVPDRDGSGDNNALALVPDLNANSETVNAWLTWLEKDGEDKMRALGYVGQRGESIEVISVEGSGLEDIVFEFNNRVGDDQGGGRERKVDLGYLKIEEREGGDDPESLAGLAPEEVVGAVVEFKDENEVSSSSGNYRLRFSNGFLETYGISGFNISGSIDYAGNLIVAEIDRNVLEAPHGLGGVVGTGSIELETHVNTVDVSVVNAEEFDKVESALKDSETEIQTTYGGETMRGLIFLGEKSPHTLHMVVRAVVNPNIEYPLAFYGFSIPDGILQTVTTGDVRNYYVNCNSVWSAIGWSREGGFSNLLITPRYK